MYNFHIQLCWVSFLCISLFFATCSPISIFCWWMAHHNKEAVFPSPSTQSIVSLPSPHTLLIPFSLVTSISVSLTPWSNFSSTWENYTFMHCFTLYFFHFFIHFICHLQYNIFQVPTNLSFSVSLHWIFLKKVISQIFFDSFNHVDFSKSCLK